MQVVQVILRGIGQVMLQNNVLSGILMLIGIAVGDWQAALLALAGNIVGNVAAWWFRYPVREIQDGLYGFNRYSCRRLLSHRLVESAARGLRINSLNVAHALLLAHTQTRLYRTVYHRHMATAGSRPPVSVVTADRD